MKRKLFYIILLFSTIFWSCEKEKSMTIENTNVPLISKVFIGGELYKDYSYNEANLVSEEKSKFHYSKHTYNYKNQVIASDFYWDNSIFSSNSRVLETAMNREEWVNPNNTTKSISHEFIYNKEGQLIRKLYIRPSSNISDFTEFLYENGQIIRITGYYNNSRSSYTDYLYDENGNIYKQLKYTVSTSSVIELTTTTEFEYDNMKNPFLSFKRLMTPGIYTNQNNIIKETYTIHFEVDPSIEKVQITENSYEYNNEGYPIRVNGIIEYIYK